MEVLRFTKLSEHFSLQLKKNFSKSDSNFVAMKNNSKNIFTSLLFIISFVITAQKLPSNKDKIVPEEDKFTSKQRQTSKINRILKKLND